MVFHPPSWVPQLPELPDNITVEEFVNSGKHGRHDLATSRSPYTCGITGKTYSATQVIQRIDHLARAIGKNLGLASDDNATGWGLNAMGWDRVIAFFSFNTIDYIPVTHAVHRLGGIVTPASAAYSSSELEHQLRSSNARALFTCAPLLDTALKASRSVGIPDEAVFILPMPGHEADPRFKSTDDLISEGEGLQAVPAQKWIRGQGARQVAYLCYSSGTSGLPKAVMISHLNTIANIAQTCTFDSIARREHNIDTQVSLGLLPMSHCYGLSIVALVSQYCGDELIVLPRFELNMFLKAIGRFRIEKLCIVPPILVQMASNRDACDEHDLSSVRLIYCGAAPLGHELLQIMLDRYPKIDIVQAYGITEGSALVLSTSELDTLVGSSGSLLPGSKAKVIDTHGHEVQSYDTPGELLLQSPSVALGYLNNEKASSEAFVYHEDGRWLKTGDEVLVRKSSKDNEHFVIVDRIKEMIKVNALQVAPAELEAHLLGHSFVSDCAVIPVPNERSGEAPKAFVVKSSTASRVSDAEVVTALNKHVEEAKARHKWLKGGIEFIEVIPKSPSGKILRRLLRDKEKATGTKMASKL